GKLIVVMRYDDFTSIDLYVSFKFFGRLVNENFISSQLVSFFSLKPSIVFRFFRKIPINSFLGHFRSTYVLLGDPESYGTNFCIFQYVIGCDLSEDVDGMGDVVWCRSLVLECALLVSCR
uniref:Uncharacterized protein n=1 Tax=Parascaris univalens TaxID=6257 RepID=A0A915BBE0_PARUN